MQEVNNQTKTNDTYLYQHSINRELIHQAMQMSNLNQEQVLNQALQLFIAFQDEQRSIQAQAQIKNLRGKAQWEGDLNEMRLGYFDEITQ